MHFQGVLKVRIMGKFNDIFQTTKKDILTDILLSDWACMGKENKVFDKQKGNRRNKGNEMNEKQMK